MRSIESMTPPKKKRKSIPREVTVLGRKVRRVRGSGQYLEPGKPEIGRHGVMMSMYRDFDDEDGVEWSVLLELRLKSSNTICASSHGDAPTWRKAVAQAEGRMLDLFRELGDRLDYEVE